MGFRRARARPKEEAATLDVSVLFEVLLPVHKSHWVTMLVSQWEESPLRGYFACEGTGVISNI